jgi:hypothetical protein
MTPARCPFELRQDRAYAPSVGRADPLGLHPETVFRNVVDRDSDRSRFSFGFKAVEKFYDRFFPHIRFM